MKMTKKELTEIAVLLMARRETIDSFDEDQQREPDYQKEIGLIENIMDKIQTALDEGRE